MSIEREWQSGRVGFGFLMVFGRGFYIEVIGVLRIELLAFQN